jgi:LPS-assembly protein
MACATAATRAAAHGVGWTLLAAAVLWPCVAWPQAKPRAEAQRGPVVVEADEIEGAPDGVTRAAGRARLGQGPLRLDAPELRYDASRSLVMIDGGGVRWARQQDLLQGTSGQFDTQRSVGEFLSPQFFFGLTRAGGSGSVIRLLDEQRLEIRDARLTSCLADEAGRPLREAGARPGVTRAPPQQPTLSDDPAVALAQLAAAPPLEAPPRAESSPGWELRSPRILVDFEREEGVAENAQLRFLGVPLAVLPRLSFPLGDARRSGWLAPTARADTRSGFEVSAPYYVNLAPDRDATVTPVLATRRGPSVELEYRHLGAQQAGLYQVHHMPQDQQLGRSRGSLYWQQSWMSGPLQLRTEGLRASDDNYWKDFGYTQTFQRRTFDLVETGQTLSPERTQATLQPRLLGQSAHAERAWQWKAGALGLDTVTGTAYARVQHWQVLQGTDPNGAFIAPYQRSPQVGVNAQVTAWGGVDVALETEVNRFTRPDMALDLAPSLRSGQRWHALASVSRPWIGAAGWIIPKLTLNAATYRLDTALLVSGTPASSSPDNLSRTIPTLSVDGGLNFERPWTFSNRSLVQTLEPRFVYVNTPMRDQRSLPNFDAAAKEFNSTSIFSENAFSGIDRVSDAHQVTMGMTTRSLDSRSGVELLRGSIAQRVQFRDQATTTAGTVSNQRLSDVLLAATVGLSPFWGLDSTVQYSPEISRTTRSVLTMRYQPRLDTTVMVSYRFARELAETVELRANWPLWRRTTGAGGNDCSLLVTGASRLNYNTRDSRLADSLAGLEMDAGCWIMRMGVQRQSTGVAEVTTRLIFQLELSGLTRSRVNPLRF